MKIAFAPSFIRAYKKLPDDLKEEVRQKIDLFKKDPNHPFLKSHKLKGRLKGRHSFSVNYKDRIVFIYNGSDEVILLAIDDHDIYK
ncbi:type II toxin-antitoxin system mRNA interferase toxin, RelE/StbE family [Candidatus Uhrbacteria bacterium]|nr:type II toxin-antitoxin system mRNA interferase toxin, RelE/StbE family [Candidatus Uhrbacteria bacterium]